MSSEGRRKIIKWNEKGKQERIREYIELMSESEARKRQISENMALSKLWFYSHSSGSTSQNFMSKCKI